VGENQLSAISCQPSVLKGGLEILTSRVGSGARFLDCGFASQMRSKILARDDN